VLLERWRDTGYPRRSPNAPPTIQFTAPTASVTACDPTCTLAVSYVVANPDSDTVTWSLAWSRRVANEATAFLPVPLLVRRRSLNDLVELYEIDGLDQVVHEAHALGALAILRLPIPGHRDETRLRARG